MNLLSRLYIEGRHCHARTAEQAEEHRTPIARPTVVKNGKISLEWSTQNPLSITTLDALLRERD